LIILALIIRNLLPFWYPANNQLVGDSLSVAEFEKFKQTLIDTVSREWNHRESEYSFDTNQKANAKAYSLFAFNPNELDSAGFVRLGLKSYVASNILKYRKKGGKFLTTKHFSHVWGIDSLKFKELEPYINIPEISATKSDSTNANLKDDPLPVVEINAADTTELMKIKGIGRGFARSIIAYREKLGGFYDLVQLMEVYHMTPEIFKKISPQISVNPQLIRKIKINTATVEKLKAHPYLNFWQAKEIYELRRKKGKLKDISDLEKISELDEKTKNKIFIYFNFD
jgi:competence ComEA-like helix-hairpin-helix protein